MTLGFLEWIAGIGGIGAVFAVIMFFVYRSTIKQQREDRKYMEDRMSQILGEYNKAVQENTKILSELFTWLKAKNGKKE